MKYTFLIPFFFISVFIFGQNKKMDSINIMALIKEGSNESDTILQLKKFEKSLSLSKKNQFNYWIFKSHKKIANWKKIKYNTDSAITQYKTGIKDLPKSSKYNYYLYELIGIEFKKNAKYDSALYYYNKSIKISNTDYLLGRSYKEIGNMWLQAFDYANAFENYAIADSIFEKNPKFKISKERAQINNYLGFCVRLTHGQEKALEYYNKSKSLYKELNNEFGVQEVNIAIAQAETNLGNYNIALKLLNESVTYHEKEKPEQNSYYYSVIVRGFLLIQMKKFEEAEKDYKLYYDLAVSSKNKNNQIRGLTYLGDFYTDLNQFQKSINYYKEAIKQCKEVNDYNRELKTTKSLIEAYKKNNDLQLAVDTYDDYIEMQNKIDKKEITKKTFELETKYQTEKKEQEIVILKSEKELTEQKQKSQRNLLIGGLGLTTFAGLFLFVLFRNRKKTNTKLKELDKAKSNFFANISHEFRTPLTLISNPIDETLEDKTLSDKKREQFVMAKRNADRLLSLVNQLLDLSKIDAGQLKLHIQKGNVQDLVSGLGESFNYLAKQNNISYALNIEKSNKDAWFDKDALEKITVNLLSNAIKYTPKNGSIICKSFIENETLHLSVKNTGIGLTKKELKNIFSRFYQTDEQNQGTGIGLALVKELVELHKGSIKVDSKPNDWISFLVTIPVDKNSFKNEVIIEAIETRTEYIAPSFKETQVINDVFEDNEQPILLIVEDNKDVRTLLKQTFEADYTILTAENGQIGIDLAIEHVPDIIISDIMMPVKDGIALTNVLKNNALTNHIPIILLTAKAGDKNEIKGIEIGADDYITKPFNSKLLKTKVSNLIAVRRKLQSRYSQEVILTPKDIAVTNLDEQFLNKIQQVLETKLIEASFSVEDFSKAVGMSRMQLHRKLKAITGLTATEFIRSQRLKLAAKLLQTSDINISQVGYSVGFNDHSYFAKCFKDAYNCTPTAFAKRNITK